MERGTSKYVFLLNNVKLNVELILYYQFSNLFTIPFTPEGIIVNLPKFQ